MCLPLLIFFSFKGFSIVQTFHVSKRIFCFIFIIFLFNLFCFALVSIIFLFKVRRVSVFYTQKLLSNKSVVNARKLLTLFFRLKFQIVIMVFLKASLSKCFVLTHMVIADGNEVI